VIRPHCMGLKLGRFRISSLMFLVVIVALLATIVVQQHRATQCEVALQAAFAENRSLIASRNSLTSTYLHVLRELMKTRSELRKDSEEPKSAELGKLPPPTNDRVQ